MNGDRFIFRVNNDLQPVIPVRPFWPGRAKACRSISALHFIERALMRSLAFLILFTGAAGSVDAAEVQCIDKDHSSIYGLMPGQPAKGYLPDNYQSVEAYTGEDDGGIYVAEKHIYDQFEINTVRGFIDSIVITSPDLLWAGRIKIGMNRGDVEHFLGFAPVYTDDSSSQYLVCSEVGDVYALLRFTQKRLESIEIVIDRP